MVVHKTYQIDPSYAGLVLGKQGRDLRALKEISGVQNVNFDASVSSRLYPLQVSAINIDACEAVYREIQRRIKLQNSTPPEVKRTFIDVNDRSLDIIELVQYDSRAEQSVVLGNRSVSTTNKYVISAFSKGNIHDVFDINIREGRNEKPNIMEFLEKNISMSFQEALDNHKSAPDEMFKFDMSPGKTYFVSGVQRGKCHLLRDIITGSNGVEYMKEQKMRHFFCPNLNPKYIRQVNQRLKDLGFENLNEHCPETFTIADLNVGPDQIPFNVVLALDENLETPKETWDDPRLNEKKKQVIRDILNAGTIGEVMGVESNENIKLKYYKLTLNVHPDQNLHPGASQAFKKLDDAYEKLQNGKSVSTKAITAENKSREASFSEKPPNVVKVNRKKIRVCTVTTMSAKELDIRGYLVGFEDDKDNLSEHVRESVNSCWDQRDSSGRIPTPEGRNKISIACVKQVLEAHDWAKEIPYVSGKEQTALLEIKIKKLREKARKDVNWNDCIEMDLSLNSDISNRERLTGEGLAREMIELKKWVDQIFE